MFVIKRDGREEHISLDKVLLRIKNLCLLPDKEEYVINRKLKPLLTVDYDSLALDVVRGIYNGVTTSELDVAAAALAEPKAFENPEYGVLAARILVSNYEKNHLYNLYRLYPEVNKIELKTHLFKYTAQALYSNVDENNNQHPLIDPNIYKIILKNADKLESVINYANDYKYDYAAIKLFEKSYLQKSNLMVGEERIKLNVERPQHLLMRVALGIHCSGTYKNIGKIRQNDTAIYEELCDTLSLYLNKSSMKKLRSKVRKNAVVWSEIINVIRSKMIPHNKAKCDLIKAHIAEVIMSVNAHTISWNELLNNYSGELDEETFAEVVDTYNLMSNLDFTHATPTLFNSGTLIPQMSSCYLIAMPEDSLDGITKFWDISAQLSKYAGGLGSSVSNIRSRNSYIAGTNGNSNGLMQMLRVVNAESVYVDQGGNKRPGSHAIYIEPWHGDIFEVVSLKKNRGNEAERARNLFYAMWLNDEFMRTIKYEQSNYEKLKESGLSDSEIKSANQYWYLMDPNVSKGLFDLYDNEFRTTYISDAELAQPDAEYRFAFTYAYRKYIKEGKYIRKVSALELMRHIYEVILETGVPYMVCKDACNRKSNQKNLGTIRSSNLCTEILEYSSSEEVAVCNLTSICLCSIITEVPIKDAQDYAFPTGFNVSLTEVPEYKYIDWIKFEHIIRRCVRNLDKIIDMNFYPVKQAKYSNLRHRPMGVGVQDLANFMAMLRVPFADPRALEVNFYLFEFMYFIALDESCNLAKKFGTYTSYPESPASQGLLQFDLWIAEQKSNNKNPLKYPLVLPWDELKNRISQHGLRNSLLLALMPTGSTSTLMNSSPCFEPFNSIVYKRKNKTGESTIINKGFINDMIKLGLWNKNIRNAILLSEKGSIADITQIPKTLRDIYKTVWDIPMHEQIKVMLVRAPFIDQTQSFSWFVPQPNNSILSREEFFAWENGAKTISYYTRRLAAVDAQKIQIEQEPDALLCSIKNKENCVMCSS